MMNISSDTVKFELDSLRYKLKPKETTRIHRNYALPRQMQPDKDPVPSVVELLTGKKVLAMSDPRVKSAIGSATQKQ